MSSKKPINESVQMKRSITLLGGCGFVIGVIIGSGIFLTPGKILSNSKTIFNSIIIWGVCGVYAMLGSLCYVELGTLIPESGGDYVYILKAYNSFIAFVFLWMSLFIIAPSCIGTTALLAVEYAHQIFSECEAMPLISKKLLATCLISFFAVLNCYKVEWITRIQNFSSLGKVIALIIIIFSGIYYMFIDSSKLDWGYLTKVIETNKTEDFYSILSSLPYAFFYGVFTYNGWAYLNMLTEEIQNPQRNLPLSIIISLPIVTIIYLLVNSAYFIALNPSDIIYSRTVSLLFVKTVFPGFAAFFRIFIPICVVLSCVGSLNGTIFSYSRLFFAGARDGRLPELISMMNLFFLTPAISVLLLALLSIILVLNFDRNFLVEFMGCSQVLVNATVILSVIILRYKMPNHSRVVKIPLIIPIIFLLFSLVILACALIEGSNSLYYAGFVVLLGVPIYILFLKYQIIPKVIYNKIYINFTHTIQKLSFSVPSKKNK